MTTMRNIQWPRAKYWDRAWNPILGCNPISPACEHCYAAAMARRFGMSFVPHEASRANPPRSGVVFCGNMTDIFGDWVWQPGEIVTRTLGPSLATYLWLTKRPGYMAKTLRDYSFAVDDYVESFHGYDMSRHYFGFTAESQEWYDRRRNVIYHDWPSWANLWISAEPLLGEIDLYAGNVVAGRRLSWVVVGCESGPRRRPCRVEWVESVVEQCVSSGVPVFVKQLDIGGRRVTDIDRFPPHLRIRQVPWRLP